MRASCYCAVLLHHKLVPSTLDACACCIVVPIGAPSGKRGAAFAGVSKNESLVRLHQYHDAHTVHKALAKLQPVEEKAFLAEYHAQVSSNQPKCNYIITPKESTRRRLWPRQTDAGTHGLTVQPWRVPSGGCDAAPATASTIVAAGFVSKTKIPNPAQTMANMVGRYSRFRRKNITLLLLARLLRKSLATIDCAEATSPGKASGAGQKEAARVSDRLSAEGREGEGQGHREVRRREQLVACLLVSIASLSPPATRRSHEVQQLLPFSRRVDDPTPPLEHAPLSAPGVWCDIGMVSSGISRRSFSSPEHRGNMSWRSKRAQQALCRMWQTVLAG